MASSSESIPIQTRFQHCSYKNTNSYSGYAVSTGHNLYGLYSERLQSFIQNMAVQGLSPNSAYSYCYPQSYLPVGRSNGYEVNSFSSASTATDATESQYLRGHSQAMITPPQILVPTKQAMLPITQAMTPLLPTCNAMVPTTQSMLPDFSMTTDYNGLLAASDPVKCHKQVHPFYWRNRGNSAPAEGMTRTKDKYRVVYTEKQRIGLEKEFKTNEFITMKTKTRLSKELDLSERQIKIWFQNRRAKERRERRKNEADQQINEGTEDELEQAVQVSKAEVSSDGENGYDAIISSVDANNAMAEITETEFSSKHCQTLQSLEELATKSQCRYQQQKDQLCDFSSVGVVSQSQISKGLPASPTEWNSNGMTISTCNVSPFSANPDWNSVYRT